MKVLQICTHIDWFTTNTTRRPNAGPMLAQRLRHQPSIGSMYRACWVLVARHNLPNK